MNQLISLPKDFAQVSPSLELLTAIFLKLKTMTIALIKVRDVVCSSSFACNPRKLYRFGPAELIFVW